MRATRAIIHLDNLQHNIRLVQEQVGRKVKICIAVKADAYGHGAVEVAQAGIKSGVFALGVATVLEGIELRQADIKSPILLYSLPIPEEIPEIVKYDITPLVADEDFIIALQELSVLQNKVIEVHIKVDTGMGRIGCQPEDTHKLARLISECSNLKLAGVCTHFPAADKKERSFTLKQIEILKRVVAQLKENNINPGIIHAANSGAIIDQPEAYFDMVRPGIMLYGYYPSQEQKRILPLKPVMELITKVVFIKKVKKGTPVSYGMTYKTGEETKIATLPLGYADGYNRLLSNKGDVFVKNKRYKICGRVCMDQCMIDIGIKSDIKLYEDVTLFGPNPQGPDGEEIAILLNSIPYEVTCNISKRVPRIYLSS